MRKNPIPFMVLAAFAIVAFTAFGSLLILRSVPGDQFKDGLTLSAKKEGLTHFSTADSGKMEPLPFFHQIRFPSTPNAPTREFPDGTIVDGIRDDTGFFHSTARLRRNQVCHVYLKNHSAREESLVAFRRRLKARFPGLTVTLAD